MKCPVCDTISQSIHFCPECGWKFRVWLAGISQREKRRYDAELHEARQLRAVADDEERIESAEPCSSPGNEFPETPRIGDTLTDRHTGIRFEWIPGGTFNRRQWSDRTKSSVGPVHEVELAGFWLGKYPVTQSQWASVMERNPSVFKGGDLPVEKTTWDEAERFVKRLNRKSGQEWFSLPTEAQWEYACRAGGTGDFCFGNNERDLGAFAWFANNSKERLRPVGQKKPNAWGLCDMHGNVWEWCRDFFGRYAPGKDPVGQTGAFRVYRGGSWKQEARICGCSFRNWLEQSKTVSNDSLGFRLVRFLQVQK